MTRLHVQVGGVELKNPVICGSGEHTIEMQGMRQALHAGAGAVVAKSINESRAAKAQLDKTDYALFDAQWRRLPWNFDPPEHATLFCRSGLVQREFEPWIDELCLLDKEAQLSDSWIVASLILSDLDQCILQAQAIEAAGLRVLEVNIGAPHASEASKGAIVLEREAQQIKHIVASLRAAVSIPLWIKLTGQSEDVVALAQAARDAGADSVVMMGRFMGFIADVETGRPFLDTSAAVGGSWGLPLTSRWIAMTRQRLGPHYPIIATNGARSGLDVARFLMAGAIATEMTSAIFVGGYDVLRQSVLELDQYLSRKGTTAQAILGQAADQLQTYQQQMDRQDHWKSFLKS